MNFKKTLCISLAVLSIFTATFAAGAQEAPETEAVIAEENDAELMAIKEVTVSEITYECDTKAGTAIAIAVAAESKRQVSIPATVKSGDTKYKVIEVADGFCNGHERVETVSFKNATNLKKIGENCFSYCPELSIVTFAESSSKLESIGNNCFYYSPNLTYVVNAEKQTNLSDVGSSVFGLTPYMDAQTGEFVMLGDVIVKYNGSNTAIKIPSGVIGIADAFFGRDIVSVDFGTEIKTIGNNAFYGCRKLESVSIPASCTKIGDMAFAGCTSLETVEYAGALASIGFCSFANCSELQAFRYTGNGNSALSAIGECAFWNDRKLVYIDTGDIKNVNVGSFWNCFGDGPDAVYYYRIPKTVETVAEGGYGNLWFSYVTVPETIKALASTAFGSTSGATYVIVKGSVADEYFNNSGYSYIYYGDMDANGKINAKDIKKVAEYLAKGINSLNYDMGRGVIGDGDNDGVISTKDLYEIFKSIREDYEAEN